MSASEIVDLFSGPRGWSEGLNLLGLRDVGLELDAAACRTARAAGHATIRCDVAQYPTWPFAGRARGLIASPPCQAWSRAGKGLGVLDQPLVHQAVHDLAHGRDTRAELRAACKDERSILAAEPMRWLHDLRPEWVCLEEVPDVLGLWRQYAGILRGWGYSTWCGILNAADYGVAQTRRRAILIASRVRKVTAPAPTHAKEPARDLFGECPTPWVSMAEALGWDAGLAVNTRGERKTPGDNEFPADGPSWALTGKTRSWVLRNGNQPRASVRTADEPAPTMAFGNNAARVEWVLHTNRNQRPDGTRQTTDPHGAPAPTLTAKSGGQWVLRRPATTVCATDRIAPPGHRDRSSSGESQYASPDTVRITVREAAVLQSFRPGYPFQGTKTAIFTQIGNAVPPLLAAHIVSAATGIPMPATVEARAAA